MSRGHLGVHQVDIPGQNFGQGPRDPGKNKHFGPDIHEKAQTSITLRVPKKTSANKNIGLDFRSATREIAPQYPVLPFLGSFFCGERQGKTLRIQGFFSPYRTPKIPGKKAQNPVTSPAVMASSVPKYSESDTQPWVWHSSPKFTPNS